MTATAQTTATESHDETFARNAAETRTKIGTLAPQSREMRDALLDLHHFDKLIRRGELYTFAGRLDQGLNFNGLTDVAFDGEPVQNVRDALRAYAEWLLLVADNAR